MATGTAIIDFGAFPGASDASVVVTGQTGIQASSLVEAFLTPTATADHTADEHLVETLKIIAGNIVPGVGFTIYGINTNQISEPDQVINRNFPTGALIMKGLTPIVGKGTLLYGKWSVAWAWL